ncbi:MAG: hypothetical protein ACOCQT_01325, partial [Desulfovermiculus sp.]
MRRAYVLGTVHKTHVDVLRIQIKYVEIVDNDKQDQKAPDPGWLMIVSKFRSQPVASHGLQNLEVQGEGIG